MTQFLLAIVIRTEITLTSLPMFFISEASHLGMPVLTAILQITRPDKYGVWNNTSDAALKKVRLWNKDWETCLAGDSYVEMNEIDLYFAEQLKIDLWTLDALWWIMKK